MSASPRVAPWPYIPYFTFPTHECRFLTQEATCMIFHERLRATAHNRGPPSTIAEKTYFASSLERSKKPCFPVSSRISGSTRPIERARQKEKTAREWRQNSKEMQNKIKFNMPPGHFLEE